MQQYHLSPTLMLGSGCRKQLPRHLTSVSGNRALLVTDKAIRELGIPDEISDILAEAGIETVIYDNVSPDPTTEQVADGLQKFVDENCSMIVAVGGGSPIDCAKNIVFAAREGNFGPDITFKWSRFPLIAIPTTAGTGSEVSQYLVITDSRNHQKTVLRDSSFIPSIAVCDAELTKSLPPGVTVNTGMDAFSHALEAYLAVSATDFTDALATKAIGVIAEYLPRAYKNGRRDMEAREKMMEAQMLGGMAFSNSGLGLSHSTSHALGSRYEIPHGRANAIMLPYILDFNLAVVQKKVAKLLPVLASSRGAFSTLQTARQVGRIIWDFIRRLDIPASLQEVGVQKEDIPALVNQAMADPAGEDSPCVASEKDFFHIYHAAYEGRMPFGDTVAGE
ncbi:MAG: iron-containing alcohol dehydrogenase family protein [bacterium]